VVTIVKEVKGEQEEEEKDVREGDWTYTIPDELCKRIGGSSTGEVPPPVQVFGQQRRIDSVHVL